VDAGAGTADLGVGVGVVDDLDGDGVEGAGVGVTGVVKVDEGWAFGGVDLVCWWDRVADAEFFDPDAVRCSEPVEIRPAQVRVFEYGFDVGSDFVCVTLPTRVVEVAVGVGCDGFFVTVGREGEVED